MKAKRTVMTFPRLLCAAAIVLVSVAGAAAKPGVATSNVNLRADPNTASDVLVKIPAGARVEIGDCNDGWCAVTYRGKSGHSIESAFDTSGRAPPRRQARRAPRGPGYVYDDDDVVDGPAPPGYVRVPGPRVYVEPAPYGYRPYWGPYWGPRWHPYWW
jgi:hypothetical protein